jgi:G6PDH family F420-dependent oxidoreductase
MPSFGYTLYCEGFSPNELVKQAMMAEQAGFEFLVISDHYHPWLTNQKHAGFAWSILGAVAQATSKIKLATMVTCPTVRYHPAIVAQMAATMGVLSGGRFTLGVGAGERLNEHVVGKGWPAPSTRHAMLREAIEIIRGLWEGEYFSYDGRFYKVEDARIFDLPAKPMQLFCAAGGPKSALLAAEMADGICITEPSAELVRAYETGGGNGTVWGQIVLSWDTDKQRALKTAHEQFRFAAGGWPVQAELPNPANFDAATKHVKPEDLAAAIPAGSDIGIHVQGIKKFLDAGITHLAVAYPGDNTAGFMKFWQQAVRPNL